MNKVNKTTRSPLACTRPIFSAIFFMIFKVGVLIGWLVGLIACTPISQYQIPLSTQKVINQAEAHHFKHRNYRTSYFDFTAWEKLQSSPQDNQVNTQMNTTHIYIEGDGNSWKTKYELSDNPTPKQPLALKLAIQDKYPHVIYLARPCQYLLSPSKNCEAKYWSSHRYSETVVNSLNEVLTQIKIQYPTTKFVLIGFSGGGTLAALLSSKRTDIAGLITVAGNLDHIALGNYHKVSPLKGSLNPIDYADELRAIPQRHFVGANDETVPPWVAEHYAHNLQSDCVAVDVKLHYSHHKGWEKNWPELIQQPLPCAT
tara:strand:- start:22509 stop:23450 length:942 start_codon:yes stop_codon:yes gene_type:complete